MSALSLPALICCDPGAAEDAKPASDGPPVVVMTDASPPPPSTRAEQTPKLVRTWSQSQTDLSLASASVRRESASARSPGGRLISTISKRLSFRGGAVAAPGPPSVDTSMLPEDFHALAWPKQFTPTNPEDLACSPRALWELAYADDARELTCRFHREVLAHRNVICGLWAPHAAHGRVRLITYEVSTDAPVGPKETRVLEFEAVRERDDELARGFGVRSCIVALDASFSDRFHVESCFEVAAADGERCGLAHGVGVYFTKHVPMLEGVISGIAIGDSRRASAKWLAFVAAELSAPSARSGPTARLQRLLSRRRQRRGRPSATPAADGDEEAFDGFEEEPASATVSERSDDFGTLEDDSKAAPGGEGLQSPSPAPKPTATSASPGWRRCCCSRRGA